MVRCVCELSRYLHLNAVQRHQLHDSDFAKALNGMAERAKIEKYIASHVFRHSFVMHMLADGHDSHVVQNLLGYKDVTTTEIYTRGKPVGDFGQQPTRLEGGSVNRATAGPVFMCHPPRRR